MEESFEILFSFEIDDGQLDGLSNVRAFVLGFELAEIFSACQRDKGFKRTVHAENQNRIRRACEHFGRQFRLSWFKNDPGEEWMELNVKPKDG